MEIYTWIVVALIIGLFLGLIVLYVEKRIRQSRKKKRPIQYRIVDRPCEIMYIYNRYPKLLDELKNRYRFYKA